LPEVLTSGHAVPLPVREVWPLGVTGQTSRTGSGTAWPEVTTSGKTFFWRFSELRL